MVSCWISVEWKRSLTYNTKVHCSTVECKLGAKDGYKASRVSNLSDKAFGPTVPKEEQKTSHD